MQTQIRQILKTKMDTAQIRPRDLERRAGLSLSSVVGILSGKTKNPSIETVLAISNVLGCSIDDLVRQNNPQIPKPQQENNQEDHKWNSNLLIEIVEYVEKHFNEKGFKPTFEQSMFFVREIYVYSLGKNGDKIDSIFAKWLINKNL